LGWWLVFFGKSNDTALGAVGIIYFKVTNEWRLCYNHVTSAAAAVFPALAAGETVMEIQRDRSKPDRCQYPPTTHDRSSNCYAAGVADQQASPTILAANVN